MICGHVEDIYKTVQGYLEGGLTEKYYKGMQAAKMNLWETRNQ